MTRIQIDPSTAEQIRSGQGPIELIDASGKTIGVVRRPPTAEEIIRAKERASRGGATFTWDELMAKVKAEVGQ